MCSNAVLTDTGIYPSTFEKKTNDCKIRIYSFREISKE